MKVTFLNSLSDEDLHILEASDVYKKSQEQSNYTNLVIEYSKEYFPDNYTNTSLILWHNNEVLIYIPSYSTKNCFSFFGSPIDIFESEKNKEFLGEGYKFVLKYLTELFKRDGYETFLFNENSYFLSEFYSKITDFNSAHIGIINLENDILFIKSCFRKSYKSLINWGERELKTQIINHENYHEDYINEFRNFHISVSGKETRNEQTWKLQGKMIESGMGFIVRSEYNDKLASVSFYQHGSKSVLYGVGVYDRALMEQNHPMAHYSLFCAIREAKRIGLEKMILGDINSNSPNHKESQIAKFKKGFVNQCIMIGNYKVDLN